MIHRVEVLRVRVVRVLFLLVVLTVLTTVVLVRNLDLHVLGSLDLGRQGKIL